MASPNKSLLCCASNTRWKFLPLTLRTLSDFLMPPNLTNPGVFAPSLSSHATCTQWTHRALYVNFIVSSRFALPVIVRGCLAVLFVGFFPLCFLFICCLFSAHIFTDIWIFLTLHNFSDATYSRPAPSTFFTPHQDQPRPNHKNALTLLFQTHTSSSGNESFVRAIRRQARVVKGAGRKPSTGGARLAGGSGKKPSA